MSLSHVWSRLRGNVVPPPTSSGNDDAVTGIAGLRQHNKRLLPDVSNLPGSLQLFSVGLLFRSVRRLVSLHPLFPRGVNCGSVGKILPVDKRVVCILKWPKDHVLQKKCFSGEMLLTHVAENASSVDLFPRLHMCLPKTWGRHSIALSASRSEMALVYGQCLRFLANWFHHASVKPAIDVFSASLQRKRIQAQCACVLPSCQVQHS